MLSPSALGWPCYLNSFTLQCLEICSRLVNHERMLERLALAWWLPLNWGLAFAGARVFVVAWKLTLDSWTLCDM